MICGVLPADVDLAACAVEEHEDADAREPLQVSYASLLAHAAHLAAQLPRGCVAVLCEGAAFAVAMFGLARAGRVALPLSPHDPIARLRVILEDAEAQAAVVHGEARELREAFPELRFVQALGRGEVETAARAREEELCYLVFTSGSTGKPKGVAVEHRHLRLYCDALNARTALGRGCRLLAATAVSWDPCLSDVHRTLLVGGTVVFVERDRLFQDLHGELLRLRIGHVFATPSWWSLLEAPADVAGISAGEPFRPPLAKLVPRVRNMYGVTEGTVAQTLGPEGGSVHAGWSIDPNAVRVELSGEEERQGEIVMVGPMIARGYWRGRQFEGRFATGDRGRLDEEGALHVLGRVDQQVKVRGHRVELGEVEAALRGLPGVRDAVAALHGQSLVACCEPEEDPGGPQLSPGPDAWAPALAQALPAAFRPAPLLRGRLPRLENGKADRRQVAANIAEFLASQQEDAGEPPLPGTERLLAELWAEVLPLARPLARSDSWFALGGTSLAAVRLLRRLPSALAARGLRADRRVAWCGLHRHPTLKGYAAFLDWAAAAPDAALAQPEALDARDPLLAAASQGDVELCKKLLDGEASPNGPWQPGQPGETPLHAAARAGHVAAAELLLQRGAKLTAGTRAQVLPLHAAAQRGHRALLALLLEAAAPAEARDWNRWPALFFAAAAGERGAVELLLARGAGANGRDRWGRTALSWACERGAEDVVRGLLEARAVPGARLQARQAEKWQADWRPEAHHAAGHPRCLALLLEARAGLGCDLRGRSVLHAAAEARCAESVRLLLEARCLPEGADREAAGEDADILVLLEAARPGEGGPRPGRRERLLFGIPAWRPAEVKRAIAAACRCSRVRVASSGQGGVCLGTAFVQAELEEGSLLLRSGAEEAEVGVAEASGSELADQAFPRSPCTLRAQLPLEGPLPPRAADLASLLAALAAGQHPGPEAEAWAWEAWAAWAPGGAAVALVEPGALGLEAVYEGLPAEYRHASADWLQAATQLRDWRGGAGAVAGAGAAAALVLGAAAAAGRLAGGEAALLWAAEWPWPEAELEVPCPNGALLVRPGRAGELGLAAARAWHAAQPWRESRSARKLWKGGVMGEK